MSKINKKIIISIIALILASFLPFFLLEHLDKGWIPLFSKFAIHLTFPAIAGVTVLYITGIKENIATLKDFNDGLKHYSQKDYKTAFSTWEEEAKNGNMKAQHNLGIMYYKGEGLEQNYKEAFKWFSKAAEQGHTEAQYNLAAMHDKGTGISQNYKEAFKWYYKAAEQKLPQAQYNLGIMYDKGEGISQNYEKAFKWFKNAAKQGHAEAQYNVASMYYEGKGVKTDLMRAYMWASIALLHGIARSEDILGNLEIKLDDSPEQIAEAKEMAVRCMKSGYKDCWEE